MSSCHDTLSHVQNRDKFCVFLVMCIWLDWIVEKYCLAKMNPSSEMNMIELQSVTNQEDDSEETVVDREDVPEEAPETTTQNDLGNYIIRMIRIININLGTTTEIPVDVNDDEDYLRGKSFSEIFKIHFKNFKEIPQVDPDTKKQITFRSALGTGFIAAIFCALRYLNS